MLGIISDSAVLLATARGRQKKEEQGERGKRLTSLLLDISPEIYSGWKKAARNELNDFPESKKVLLTTGFTTTLCAC